MNPGRAPKPTILKMIDGNKGKRAIEKDAVAPAIAIPDCPDHLTNEAKVEWQRIAPFLLTYQLVTDLDTAALALYCQAYGRWQQAEKQIAKIREADKDGDGLLVKAPSGYPIQNPYLAIANRAMEDCHKYLQQFGLSPSARTRVVVNLQGELFGEAKKQNWSF